jgi:hypothetical protein
MRSEIDNVRTMLRIFKWARGERVVISEKERKKKTLAPVLSPLLAVLQHDRSHSNRFYTHAPYRRALA